MADNEKEIIISVKTDASQASQGVDELKGKLQDVNDTPIDKPFKGFKAEIKQATLEAQRMAEQFGKNSKEFAEASKRVQTLKNDFDEFNISVNAFNPDNRFQSVIVMAKGATGAIQGVTGGMQFLGIESGKAEEQIAKLQGLMAFSNSLNSIGDIKDGFKAFGSVIQNTTVFQKANAAATTVASVATKGLGIAAETTSIGFKVLKGAIVATGIGALVIGLIMLIQNFDSVKKSVLNLIPGLSGIASFIGKIINAITDFVGITSEAERQTEKLIKTTEKQIKASEEWLDTQGYKYDEFTKKKIQANIDYNKKVVELNKDETRTEKEKQELLKQYREKANWEINKADADRAERVKKQEEEAKKKADDEAKRLAEKQKQQRENYKKNLESIQAIIDEARKKQYDANANDREKEISDVRFTYNEKYKAIQKAYEETILKTKELSRKKNEAEKVLLESAKEQELAINKKYHDKVLQTLNEANQTEYEKQRNEIIKKYDDLIMVAEEADRKLLESAKARDLNKAGTEQTAKINVVRSETNLIRTERENALDENDTPAIAKLKIMNLADARIQAENEAFELKKIQLQGQNEELEKAREEHESKLTEIQKSYSDSRKAVDKAEKEAKLSFYSSIGTSAEQLGEVLGKQTVAGKALAIAGIIAQQASTIGKIVMSTQEANVKAVAASPLTGGQPWVTVNTIQGVIAGAASVAAGAKAIAAIGGSGGASNVGDVNKINAGTAPQINAQSATQQSIQDVRVTNTNQAPIKAYITNSDLQTNQQKTNFLNSISTI